MPRAARVVPSAVLAVVAAGLITGCGGDDSTATGAGYGAARTTTQAAAASGPTGAATGSGAVTVRAREFAFTPSALTAKAGKVKLTLDDQGAAEHELVLLKSDRPEDALPVEGGAVSEKDSVGEIPEIAAGTTKSHVFDLAPGKYVFVCNIPGHYANGMHGTLTVR